MVPLPRGLGTTVRIAFVHSFYRSENPSGENAVVQAEVSALQRAGHDARLFSLETDALRGDPLYPLRIAGRVASGRGRDPLEEIRAFDPDIVHIHNLFPNYGREWVRHLQVPLVVTLHNYRPLCAKAMLFRDGHVCTLCPDGARWSGVRYACYRGSRVATLPLAWANRHGAGADPVLARSQVVIALSERMRDLYASDGVDWSKIRVEPNFLRDELVPDTEAEVPSGHAPWLFVGRFDEAKGLLPLLRRWPQPFGLRVVGDGPQHDLVRSAVRDRPEIELLGPVSRSDVLDLMRTSVGLVFPSRWYEGFPLTYVEALACGLPVLAFAPNVVADLVERDGSGRRAERHEPLTLLLSDATTAFPSLRGRCREVFTSTYSEAVFLTRRMDLYEDLVSDRIA